MGCVRSANACTRPPKVSSFRWHYRPVKNAVFLVFLAASLFCQTTARFEPLYREALSRAEKQYGNADPRTAEALTNLAQFLHQHGRPDESEPLLRRALQILAEREAGERLPGVFESLADVRLAQGDGEEAESLLKKCLALRGQTNEAAGTLDRLSALLRLKGNFEEAEEYSRQAIAHGRTATRLRGLAVILEARNKRQEAESLHRETLLLQEEQFGPSHPDVALTLNSLALLASDRGEFPAAAVLLQRALEIFRNTLGPKSAEAATALDNLGNVRRSLKEYARAERLLRQALEIRREILGSEHPDTAATLHNLAGLYQVQGRLAAAEPLYQQAIAIRQKQLGENHVDTAVSVYNLGHLLASRGQRKAAADLFARALKALESTLGPDDPLTAEVRASLDAAQRR